MTSSIIEPPDQVCFVSLLFGNEPIVSTREHRLPYILTFYRNVFQQVVEYYHQVGSCKSLSRYSIFLIFRKLDCDAPAYSSGIHPGVHPTRNRRPNCYAPLLANQARQAAYPA